MSKLALAKNPFVMAHTSARMKFGRYPFFLMLRLSTRLMNPIVVKNRYISSNIFFFFVIESHDHTKFVEFLVQHLLGGGGSTLCVFDIANSMLFFGVVGIICISLMCYAQFYVTIRAKPISAAIIPTAARTVIPVVLNS